MGTLIFLLTAALVVLCVCRILYLVLHHRFTAAASTIGFMVFAMCLYAAVLISVSLMTHVPTLAINTPKCFDDWCAAVAHIRKLPSVDDHSDYIVTVTILNTGRGRAQRPDHPHIYIVDDRDVRYEILQEPNPPINKQVAPGESFQTDLQFRLPKGAMGYVVITEGGFPTPLIIGDEGSFLHEKSMTPINKPF